jgi:SRSO17 transposase
VTWREGTKGKLSGHFAWLRVWPGGGWATGECAGAEPTWVLIERQADGKLKYAFSDLPPDTTRLRAVRLWKTRWPVEQGYQQMKEELGLAHFEGRSWRGFHPQGLRIVFALEVLIL